MTVLYYEPVFYGIRDVTIAADGGDFAARVYFPSHDGAVWTAPIRPGTYPLVVFAHGDRSSEASASARTSVSSAGRPLSAWSVTHGAPAHVLASGIAATST